MHTNAQTQIPKINFCEREIKETNWDTSEMKQTKEKKNVIEQRERMGSVPGIYRCEYIYIYIMYKIFYATKCALSLLCISL